MKLRFVLCLLGCNMSAWAALLEVEKVNTAVTSLAVAVSAASSTWVLYLYVKIYMDATALKLHGNPIEALRWLRMELFEAFHDLCIRGAFICASLSVLQMMQLLDLRIYLVLQVNLLVQGFALRILLEALPKMFQQ